MTEIFPRDSSVLGPFSVNQSLEVRILKLGSAKRVLRRPPVASVHIFCLILSDSVVFVTPQHKKKGNYPVAKG